jgi:glutamate synthase (NADPH/NADH) small chain
MGDPRGFLTIKRQEAGYRPVEERVNDYSEVEKQLPEEQRMLQASRCMDCGVPFCHWGCPVGNIMPEWQDALFRGDWEEAYRNLQETNSFPEFTGRVCPAPCEASCVLSINDLPVTIRNNELDTIEKAFAEGYVKANPPEKRTGKKVAVIGGGPAGMACADILNRKGHRVTLYEADDQVGGYLRFGIPDFKLEKQVVDRRLALMEEEGVIFKTGVRVGTDLPMERVLDESDAVCMTIGARKARDLPVEGRELSGIHFAMEYLKQQNRIIRGDDIPSEDQIHVMGKNVVVIGGGDTGSDCVGTANRKAAKSVTQIELMPKPPEHRTDREPWPLWPRLLKISSSHEEGCERMWNVLTKGFTGEKGRVKSIQAVQVEWTEDDSGRMQMHEVPGSEFELKADVVFLAMGFVHVEQEGPVSDLGLALDNRGNIEVDGNWMTSREGVFAAGDSHRGASLVVWAIHEGREAAESMHRYLSGVDQDNE